MGLPGSGKTYKIRQMIKNLSACGKSKIILIVPEQSSFENEKEILDLLGAKNTQSIKILSFSRLADIILEQIGSFPGRRLDDGGRNIIMSLALEEIKDRLDLFRKQPNDIETIKLLTSALKEFKMCSITPDSLNQKASDMEDSILKEKLKQTALLVYTYDALVTQSYVDPLDNLTKLANALKTYNFFSGCTVFLDGFHGFTGQELDILELIFKQADESYVSLCTDSFNFSGSGMELMFPVNRTANQLMRIAENNSIGIAKPIILNDLQRFLNDELKHITANAFPPELKKLESGIENVILYSAADIYDECDFVARTIRKFIIEDKYNYKDFSVISRATEQYRGILDTVLEKYEIPFFMDKPEPIESKPLIGLILTAFDIIHNSFDSKDILKYLKTGLTGIEAEEISLLENYILLWDIRGKQWCEEFTLNPQGFSENFTESGKNSLLHINNIRNKVISPLISFSQRIKTNDSHETARAVYLLLQDLNASEHVINLVYKLKVSGEIILADEQLRLWDMTMSILNQTVLVLKDKNINSKRYAELLKLVVCANDISFIPKGLDEVTVGAIDRTRTNNPKVTFIIGAVEGEFPRTPVSSGVFTDSERRFLIASGLPMYDSLEQLAKEERFLAYTAMTSSREKLFVSWRNSDLLGTIKSPSIIVREIKKILPNIKVIDEWGTEPQNLAWCEKASFELCAKQWKLNTALSAALKKYFSCNNNYSSRLVSLERAADSKPAAFEDLSKVKCLFGNNMHFSASQIEQYYLCRFKYFCMYGLKAKERKPATFDALEYGSVMHFVLEKILLKYSCEELNNADKSTIREDIKIILSEYVGKKLGGWDNKTPRFKYLFLRLCDISLALIIRIAREFSQSEFKPAAYELEISQKGDVPPLLLKLPDGSFVSIEGKVDRLDVMKKDEKSYVRIIDYKTGVKEFKLSDIIYGLNIQMLIYLAAIERNGKSKFGDVVPAGILYMPANKPVINSEKNITAEKLQKEIDKKMRMNGLILDSPEIIAGMEKDAQGVFIPVALKNGVPAKSDSIVNLSQMGHIFKHVEKLVISMAQTLKNGAISPTPLIGEYDSCEWCPYSSICGHENGDNANLIKKWDKDSVIQELCEGED